MALTDHKEVSFVEMEELSFVKLQHSDYVRKFDHVQD